MRNRHINIVEDEITEQGRIAKELRFRKMLEQALAKINWRLVEIGCGIYAFYNHYNQRQPIQFYYDRIELDTERTEHYGVKNTFSMSFYLKDVEIDYYTSSKTNKPDGVGFRGKDNKSIFLNCYNHTENLKLIP